MRERGWVSRRNITIEHRAAEGRSERLPQLAAELVQARVSVMVTSQSPSTQAAKKASGTILATTNGGTTAYSAATAKLRLDELVDGRKRARSLP